MGLTINLDKNLIDVARSYFRGQHRSVPKQIEHWAQIGRIAEENPGLSYAVIKGLLQAKFIRR